MPETIPFTRPYRAANEIPNLTRVLEFGLVHGDGPFTKSASERLRAITGSPYVLLTTSGTHALEAASLLLGLGPGDEVIMPSFTFSSAANAVALTGATIVFVDIDPATGDIDPAAVERNITETTAAISIMHYGGVACDMDALLRISAEHDIPLIEDNAHGLGATWRGRTLGTLGKVAIQSFHDTKNIHSGEGGALLMSDPDLYTRAEIIREKGTDRSRFLRGQVDKYSWTDVGSSFLPSELNAAVLDAQLEEFDHIQALRHEIWNRYDAELRDWARESGVQQMTVPADREHPAHVYYLVMSEHAAQTALIAHLKTLDIVATFHYVPLDSSRAGLRFGRTPEPCVQSADFSERLVRLPLWAGMSREQVDRVIAGVHAFANA